MPKETLDIWAVPDCDAPEGFNLRLNPTDRRYYMGEDAVRLGSTEVFFDTPADMTREQMALKAVETLQERQEQVMAEAKLKR